MRDDSIMAQRIAAELRKSILENEYPAGSELRQEQLAERFSVSRMPVRQALQLLAEDGLVTLRKNRSAIVNIMTEQDIRDHFELRGLLEGQAAAFAAQRGTDFSYLKELTELELQASKEAAVSRWETYNYEFHNEIWRLANCKRLRQMIQQVWNAVSYVEKESPATRMERSIGEHQQIYQAIAAKDPELARIMMHRHIVNHNISNFFEIE